MKKIDKIISLDMDIIKNNLRIKYVEEIITDLGRFIEFEKIETLDDEKIIKEDIIKEFNIEISINKYINPEKTYVLGENLIDCYKEEIFEYNQKKQDILKDKDIKESYESVLENEDIYEKMLFNSFSEDDVNKDHLNEMLVENKNIEKKEVTL